MTTLIPEQQKKAFRRVVDLLQEKKRLRYLRTAEEQSRLLSERDVLIKKYQRIYS